MWEQLASAGSAIGPALIDAGAQIIGSRSAARKQRRAVDEANRLLGGYLDQNLSDLSPYRSVGGIGVREMERMLLDNDRFGLDDFEADPGYQFRLSEGEKLLNRNALARGRYFAGSTGKALSNYGQNMASEEFGNAFDRWRAQNNDRWGRASDSAQLGFGATRSGNQDRYAFGSQMSGNIIGRGNAEAGARMAQANAVSDFASTIGNWMQGQNALRRNGSRPRPAYSSAGTDPYAGT